ncbi:TonB family protein [Arenimonas sp. MALMAid1274]|uniref:TonB family protein n=1 Tax=Arenimonas sp. MALMAid1274 TaxID=3411630 RepID=UPI003BA20731
MAAELFDWLLRSTLALSVAIALVMALRPLWRRWLGAGGVLWLWLLLPAALLATSLPRPVQVVEQDMRGGVAANVAGDAVAFADRAGVSERDISQRPIAAPSMASASLASPVASSSSGPWPGWTRVLVGLWFIGALALLERLVHQQRQFRQRLGRLSPRADGSWLASSGRIGPAVVGVLRPRIVLPADFEQRYDEQQRHLVLAHERVHLRRGDLQVNLMLCALRCVFWFNPLVHVAVNRLRVDQELACDAEVLRHHPRAGRAYATALLNTQLAELGLPVGCYWQSAHPLKWRIAMLQRPRPAGTVLMAGAGVALLASVAAAAAMWQVQPVQTLVLPAALAPARAVVPSHSLHAPDGVTVQVVSDVSLGELSFDVPLRAMPDQAAPLASSEPAAGASSAATAPAAMTAGVGTSPSSVVTAPAALPSAQVSSVAATDTAATATATAVEPSRFEPPRVTRMHLANPPMRAKDRFYEREQAGRVVVEVQVDAEGRPGPAEVVHNDIGERYAVNALRAVKRWKFEPARRDGVAVVSTVQVPVLFDLRKQTVEQFWIDAVGPRNTMPGPSVSALMAANRR